MPSTGLTLPGDASQVGSGLSWVNEDNILVDDEATAAITFGSASLPLKDLVATQFGFELPVGSVVLGIEVEIPLLAFTSDMTVSVHLTKNASSGVGTPNEGIAPWPIETVLLGGPANLWGTTWTRDEVNANGFGVIVQITGGALEDEGCEVEYIKANVFYEENDVVDTGLVVRYYLDEAGSGFADAPSTSLILVPDEDPLSTDWSPTRPSANTREVKASGGVLSRATAGTPSGGMSHYDGAAFGPNLEAWAEVETLPPSGQGVSLTLCVTAGAGGTSSVDYYQGTYTVGTGWRMFYVVNNGYTQLGSTVAAPVLAVGDKIWFLRTNGVMRLYHQPDGSDEWDLVMSNTFTHASIPTTGGIGVELTDGVGQLKNFGGGTWTSQAEDAGPNAYHFTDIDYSFDSMQWIEDGSGNRGLDSTVLDNNQHVVRAMGDSGDPLRTALEGAQKIVIELVADPREGSANNARLIALNGRAGNNAALGITMPTASSPALALAWEGVAISSNLDAGTGRKVFHWVIDTTQATSADRLKVYVDGVFVGTVTNTLALNDTLVLPASLDFLLFNRFSGSVYDRSPDATLYYAAIYTGDFDAARVEDHANLLAADDDTPLAAPPPYFDVPAFRIVPMRMG